ncbi:sodium/nucleoside cotransporter 1 isoform X4 [Manis javanica]|uniref:sodium/nucleoside cotransporter 1 isoform X4 n=1 Tax=Manis javanica TaxID=9974 RepID=UPI003C6D6831
MSAVTMGSPFLSAADEKGNIALTVLSANQPRFKREKQVWGNDREVMCREPSQVGAPLLIHCLDTRIKKAMGETPPVKSQQSLARRRDSLSQWPRIPLKHEMAPKNKTRNRFPVNSGDRPKCKQIGSILSSRKCPLLSAPESDLFATDTWKVLHMEDNIPRWKESISLSSVANGLENMGAEFLESMEEGRTPGSNNPSPPEGGDSWSEAGPEPLSGWRSLRPALRARRFCRAHTLLFRWICTGLLCTAFAAFLVIACLLDFQRALALFVFTCVVLALLAHGLLKRLLGPRLLRWAQPLGSSRLSFWLKRGLALAAFLGLVLWLILDTSQRPEQLVSFAGICVFVGFLFACSKHHGAVSWRAVAWGLGLQFILGLFVIRTEPGFIAFQWLGGQIQIFLSYTEAGSSFVFGEALIKDVFAFQVLPIIVFFSCVMSILYHVGLMQWVILKIAWLMQATLGTMATETLSVAGNIFVSQTEAPLLIRPYLADMTLSEIHVVMTGGYATIAGSLLGAYISFGF